MYYGDALNVLRNFPPTSVKVAFLVGGASF